MYHQDRVSAARRQMPGRRARAIAATATQDVALPALTGLVLLGIACYLVALLG